MGKLQIGDKTKDTVLNVLVILSLVLLYVYITHRSTPKSTNNPSPLGYSISRLEPVATQYTYQYSTLEPIGNTSSGSTVYESTGDSLSKPAEQVGQSTVTDQPTTPTVTPTPGLLSPVRSLVTTAINLNLF